jgi:hypothetical protein
VVITESEKGRNSADDKAKDNIEPVVAIVEPAGARNEHRGKKWNDGDKH